MKSDFLLAITQLAAEKNLPKETVIAAVETALVSAYKKDTFSPSQNIAVKISSVTGKVQVWAEKTVVEHPADIRREISLDEAHQINPNAQLGENIVVEATPHNAGRIAAQTAKQVILQRLHEAEHSAILEEYADKEGEIVAGTVQRIEPSQLLIDLGRTEAVLPFSEQVPGERYRVGQRLKVHLLKVAQTSKGTRVVVSRSHPDLLRRLLELEVPEILNGTVELKSVAREAGHRSKIAVEARQEGIDAVGCCVGLRGIRIQNIVSELNGEKIDVVTWSQSAPVFIANALSPARVLGVELNKEEGAAVAVVPDKQLSLAIGKEGQNVRLAAKLTSWRIDIKSASTAEAEKLEAAKLLAEAEEAKVVEEPVEEIPAEMLVVPSVEKSAAEAEEEPEGEPIPALETELIPPQITFEPEVSAEKRHVRFAEDIIVSGAAKPVSKSKKKKKGTAVKEDVEGIRRRKHRRQIDFSLDDEEY
jgi:N utilization substance protein A